MHPVYTEDFLHETSICNAYYQTYFLSPCMRFHSNLGSPSTTPPGHIKFLGYSPENQLRKLNFEFLSFLSNKKKHFRLPEFDGTLRFLTLNVQR